MGEACAVERARGTKHLGDKPINTVLLGQIAVDQLGENSRDTSLGCRGQEL